MLHIESFGSNALTHTYTNLFYALGVVGDVKVIMNPTPQNLELGFAPIESARNIVGDRNCSHHNFKGNLFLAKEPIIDNEMIQFDYPTTWTFLSGPRTYTIPYVPANYYAAGVPANDTFVLRQGDAGSISYGDVFYRPAGRSIYWKYAYLNQKLQYSFIGSRAYYRYERISNTYYKNNLVSSNAYLAFFDVDYSLLHPGTDDTSVVSVGTYKKGLLDTVYNINDTLYFNRCQALNPTVEDDLNRQFSLLLTPMRSCLPDIAPDRMTGVIADAVSNCHVLENNMIAFGIDVKNIKRIGTALKSLTEVRNLKSAATAYLSNKYGTANMVRDSVEILSVISGYKKHRLVSGRSIAQSRDSVSNLIEEGRLKGQSCTTEFSVKLYYRPLEAPMRRFLQKLYDYDIWPSFENLWDLIPYSFVVDWFVGVSDYLSARDAENYVENIDIISLLETRRSTIHSIPGSVFYPNLRGTFDYTYYHRYSRSSLPPMTPSLHPKTFHNFWEAAALVVQRSK